MLHLMQIVLAHIGAGVKSKHGYEAAVLNYLERCSGIAKSQVQPFGSERALLGWLEKQRGRTAPLTVLLDSRGRQMSSDAFAAWLGERRDEGVQQIIFAIGPADGWSEAARARAQLLLSLGPMTLAHELARLVMAEQIYRAVTILTGHPYHTGH